MVQHIKKPSAYSKLPGMQEANKAPTTSKVKQRAMDFEGGEKSLQPPEQTGPKAQSIVKNPVLREKLSQHLVKSGRSDGEQTTSKLGGKLSPKALGKREEHSATILQGMEKATIDYQKGKGQTNLAHPYTAHGPGSDQVGRLLEGHRADEHVEGVGEKELGGNDLAQKGIYKGKDHKTVGSAPTNTSGGFSSNFGMLNAVQEGFAQASMLDAHVAENKDSKASSGRISTTVKGTGENIGYNLEVPNAVKQTPGMPLAKDEMEARYKMIKRDDELTHANVVLDPVTNDKGQRMGWNLQTAYAVKEDKNADLYTDPSQVGGKQHDLGGKVAFWEKSVATAQAKFDQITKDGEPLSTSYKGLTDRVKGLPGRVSKLKGLVGKAKSEGGDGKKEEEDLAAAEKELQDAKNELALVEVEYKTKVETPLADAKKELDEAKKQHKAAELALKKYKDGKKKPGAKDEGEEAQGEGGAQLGGPKGAGYNPELGKWTGDRPEKPRELDDQLKGKDKNNQPLTAHHLYPWNKIMADLNAALASKDQSGLERIFMFGGQQADANFWEELKKDPAERNYAFSETLNKAVPYICWAPANIMMGPGARKDDPGEEIDAKPSAELGGMTSQSILAELMHKQGGMHKKGLGSIYMRNLRERDGGVAPADKYNKEEWGYDGTGKDAKPFLLGGKNGQKQVGNKMVKDEPAKWTTSPNPKHDENELNPNLKAEGKLTGKVPKLTPKKVVTTPPKDAPKGKGGKGKSGPP